MYYTYMKLKDYPLSDMGGFTRTLHDGKEDDLMEEIPTFVAKPLPSDRGYVILNRPWGVWQWLARTQIDEDSVLMLEPDYIFTKPMPNLATHDRPAAGSYSYIQPEVHKKILQDFYPEEKGNITDIDPIGAVPVLIEKTMLKTLVPTWLSVSMILQDDQTSRKELGWLLEMYGYATAAAIHNLRHQLDRRMFLQPPYDQKLGEGYTIHYTYPMDYTSRGPDGGLESHTFDKRNYIRTVPAKDLPAPSNETLETVHTLLNTIKEASNTLPNGN